MYTRAFPSGNRMVPVPENYSGTLLRQPPATEETVKEPEAPRRNAAEPTGTRTTPPDGHVSGSVRAVNEGAVRSETEEVPLRTQESEPDSSPTSIDESLSHAHDEAEEERQDTEVSFSQEKYRQAQEDSSSPFTSTHDEHGTEKKQKQETHDALLSHFATADLLLIALAALLTQNEQPDNELLMILLLLLLRN